MLVWRSLDDIDPDVFPAGSAVAIGKFDGLHLGHQAIFADVAEASRVGGELTVVCTFTANPLAHLRPEMCPPALMSPEQRLEAMEADGVDVCLMLDFDDALAAMTADAFVREVLVKGLRAKRVSLGSDFRFGHRRAGSPELLRTLGAELGFEVDEVDWVEVPGAGEASSSRIREAMLSGDIERASALLGRLPEVRATVVRGDARGREIGFPTANLGGRIEGLVPADGVYAGWVRLPLVDVDEWLPAAISVGNNPTFTPHEQSRVEAFILDFDRDIYDEPIEVRFAHRLRPTLPFDSVELLVDQMRADIDLTRSLLGLS